MSDKVEIDGRSARRDRNLDAVVEAAIELIVEGHVAPGVTEIADRAGVSYRSVFRYFPERDDVVAAALSRACDRLESEAAAATDDLPAARVELWERSSSVARALRLGAAQSAEVAERLSAHRKVLRGQTKAAYKKQLDKLPKADQAAALAGIDLATSFESYESFRLDMKMSKPKAAAASERLVSRALRK
ncbi:MAG: TetR/AcrR family transcriptional regulator [Acidimicrobiales bacterium]